MKQNIQIAKRVVVTGAAGFVGLHLVKALLEQGHEVVALIRRRALPEGLTHPGLKVVDGDITQASIQNKILEGADTLCHLAAFIPPNYEDASYAEDCLKTNGLLTMHLAQQALKHKVRMINFSTAALYRYCDQPVDEDAPLYPSQKAVYYAASKLFGELTVEHLRDGGLQAVTFRVGSCYGFGMPDKSVVAHFMKSAAQGLTLNVTNAGIARYDYVHVADVVKLTLAAIESGECGIYNVGTGRSSSVTELAETVAQVYAPKKVTIDHKPIVDDRLKGLPALSIEKARKVWGFSPLSLQEGLILYRQDLEQQMTIKSRMT